METGSKSAVADAWIQMYDMCLKKKPFHDRGEVEEALARLIRAHGTKFRVYSCPICGSYHLTSKIVRGD